MILWKDYTITKYIAPIEIIIAAKRLDFVTLTNH